MEKRKGLKLFLLSGLFFGLIGVFWWSKKRVKMPDVVRQSLEINQPKEGSNKNKEEPVLSKTSVEPTLMPISAQDTSTPTITPPKDTKDNESGLLRGDIRPPTHPYYQPSSTSAQGTIEAFLEAAEEGNPDNFPYFLTFEARNNQKIHLVPEGWSSQVGKAVISYQMKGDGETVKIVVTFYKREKGIFRLEEVGYFLVKSFGKWLIFDTVSEKG